MIKHKVELTEESVAYMSQWEQQDMFTDKVREVWVKDKHRIVVYWDNSHGMFWDLTNEKNGSPYWTSLFLLNEFGYKKVDILGATDLKGG